MDTSFTPEEQKLIAYSKDKILKHVETRKNKELSDIIFAFVISESGNIYEGNAFEPQQPYAGFCAERHAIANMILVETEKAKIISILTAGPVPKVSKKSILPCGLCRFTILEYATPSTTFLASEFIRNENDWNIFPKIEKYFISELCPAPYEPVKWE